MRPDLVADKDGISAALLVLRLAAELAAGGRTLAGRLDDLALAHGLHVTRERSLRADGAAGLARLADAVERVRKQPPRRWPGSRSRSPTCARRDRRGSGPGRRPGRARPGPAGAPGRRADLARGGDARVMIRPSGTEPVLKLYAEVVRPVRSRTGCPPPGPRGRARRAACSRPPPSFSTGRTIVVQITGSGSEGLRGRHHAASTIYALLRLMAEDSALRSTRHLPRLPASPAGASASAGLTWPPRAFSLSLRPRARMFLAAFTSRSWTAPHASHVHPRTLSGFGPSLTPHAEHTWLVGSHRPIRRKSRPYRGALYSSIPTNADQPASCTDFASRVRPSPATARSSTYTAWFSRMILVESLWWKSRRASATRGVARATLRRDRSRLPRRPLPARRASSR